MPRTHRRAIRAVALVAGAGVAIALAPGGTANAAPAQKSCDNRTNTTVQALLECVRAAGAVEHLEALQDIADANGGNRALGSPGYDASVDYVVQTLRDKGFDVTTDDFEVRIPFADEPVVTVGGQRIKAAPLMYTAGTPKGGVTGRLVPARTGPLSTNRALPEVSTYSA